MNETMQIDHAVHGFGPGAKRIKTEHSRAGDNGFANAVDRFSFGGDRYGPGSVHINGAVNNSPPISDHRKNGSNAPASLPSLAIGPLPPPALSMVNQNSPPAATTGSNSHAIFHSHPPAQPDLIISKSPLTPNNPRADIPTLPLEAPRLVWWLLDQATQASSNLENGLNMDPSNFSSPNTPQSASAPPVSYHEPDGAAEKDRLRQENRVRKQRWRQDNQERNKDNDLRCRVNKLAKQKYGAEDSTEKAAFIEHEFTVRRAKREQKQRNRAQHSGTVPTFSSTNGLSNDTKLGFQSEPSQPVAHARDRAIDILRRLGNHPRDQPLPADVLEEAGKLSRDLEGGALRPETLLEGIRHMASTDMFRLLVHPSTNEGKSSDGRGSINSEEDIQTMAESAAGGPTTLRSGEQPSLDMSAQPHAVYPPHVALVDDSNAINQSYASPYSKPESPRESPHKPITYIASAAPTSDPAVESKPKGKQAMRDVHEQPESVKHPEDAKLTSKSTIDALLELATGSLSDDDEDEDEDDMLTDAHLAVRPKRHGVENARTNNGKTPPAPRLKLRHDAAKNRAAGLRKSAASKGSYVKEREGGDLHDIEVNTIVPVAKAHAASKLGQSPGHSSTTLSGLDASRFLSLSNGKTADMTIEEEQRKIKMYGYPPLPSIGKDVFGEE